MARTAPRNGPSQYCQKRNIYRWCVSWLSRSSSSIRIGESCGSRGVTSMCVRTCELPQPSIFFARTRSNSYGHEEATFVQKKKRRLGGSNLRSIGNCLGSLSLRRGQKNARCSYQHPCRAPRTCSRGTGYENREGEGHREGDNSAYQH